VEGDCKHRWDARVVAAGVGTLCGASAWHPTGSKALVIRLEEAMMNQLSKQLEFVCLCMLWLGEQLTGGRPEQVRPFGNCGAVVTTPAD
jgi:hypothetical protein